MLTISLIILVFALLYAFLGGIALAIIDNFVVMSSDKESFYSAIIWPISLSFFFGAYLSYRIIEIVEDREEKASKSKE